MPRTINGTKKFWKGEDADTKKLKDWFRAIARRQGCGCVEEERFAVDLHDTNPLLPKGTMRSYPVDLYITRRNPPYAVIVEIDGKYHYDFWQNNKDVARDNAITQKYGIQIVRFDKEALLSGKFTEEEIIRKLGI